EGRLLEESVSAVAGDLAPSRAPVLALEPLAGDFLVGRVSLHAGLNPEHGIALLVDGQIRLVLHIDVEEVRDVFGVDALVGSRGVATLGLIRAPHGNFSTDEILCAPEVMLE